MRRSVAEADLYDPYVFGPHESGSGSFIHRYGSGSFYEQAKNSNKSNDSFCFVTFFTFIFEKWCKCTFKK